MSARRPPVQSDPWDVLRRHTPARIALGRAGQSLPTREVLRFGLEHARARDAVHLPLDTAALAGELQRRGFATLQAHSRAPDRATYLARPDFGRRLREEDRQRLEREPDASRLVLVVADGLSSIAVERHALPVLTLLREQSGADWPSPPVVLAQQGRVALGDDIGEALRTELVVVLIGERPGLTSPDSLGVYLTFRPRVGRMDSERNCISNIRPEGLPYEEAVRRLHYLMHEARRRGLSGVQLKDDSAQHALNAPDERNAGAPPGA